MANLKVTVNDYRFDHTHSKVVAFPTKIGGCRLDSASFSFDGGRLSVYLNGVEVVSTSTSEDCNVELQVTKEPITEEL